jgi:glycosyltransferase involved in cell wall biosynthesis
VVSVSGDEALAMSFGGRSAPPVATAFHVESESLAALLNGARATAVVAVIPPVPDPVLLAEQQAPPSPAMPLRILGIGPLSWTQGYEHALSAVRLLMERGVPCEYRIAGRGEYCDPINFACRQLRLGARVALVEPRSRSELRDLLRWATVLVDASVAPTSPKPILDAHAGGVPVVTTERATHRDAVLVVRRRDPKALAAALNALVGDGALRARLADAGRKRALRALGEAEQAARFGDLYFAATGRSPSRVPSEHSA